MLASRVLVVTVTPPRMKRLTLIILGSTLLLFGLFLTLMIIVYSIKEGDNEVYKYLIFSGIIDILAVYLIIKGVKKTNSADT